MATLVLPVLLACTGGGVGPGSGSGSSSYIASALPDLVVSAQDIIFRTGTVLPGDTVPVSAVVRNVSSNGCGPVLVHLLENGSVLAAAWIDWIAPDQAAAADFEYIPTTAGARVLMVSADPANVIAEADETNNQASRWLYVGAAGGAGDWIVVTAIDAYGVEGNGIVLSGEAHYDLSQDGLITFPVQGGQVHVILIETGFVAASGHTDTQGNFAVAIQSPLAPGWHAVRIEVTDTGVTGRTEAYLVVLPGGGVFLVLPDPPAPGSAPGFPPPDIYLHSDDIALSPSWSVASGAAVGVTIHIHYFGSQPVLQVPVLVREYFIQGGVLVAQDLLATAVDFPDGGLSVPEVSLTFFPQSAGPHVLQVAVSPSFEQYAGNDAATRLLLVGPSTQTASLDAGLQIIFRSGIPAEQSTDPGAADPLTDQFKIQGQLSLPAAGLLPQVNLTMSILNQTGSDSVTCSVTGGGLWRYARGSSPPDGTGLDIFLLHWNPADGSLLIQGDLVLPGISESTVPAEVLVVVEIPTVGGGSVVASSLYTGLTVLPHKWQSQGP